MIFHTTVPVMAYVEAPDARQAILKLREHVEPRVSSDSPFVLVVATWHQSPTAEPVGADVVVPAKLVLR